MQESIDTWLADLILANADLLADEIAQVARGHSRAHQILPPDVVHAGFAGFYRALAASIRQGDTAPVRDHMEKVIPSRIQAGSSAEDLLQLVADLQGRVEALVARESAHAPDALERARRRLKFLQPTVRLILSEINLRRLRPPAPGQDGPPQ